MSEDLAISPPTKQAPTSEVVVEQVRVEVAKGAPAEPQAASGPDGLTRLIAWVDSPSGTKVLDQFLKSSALGSTLGHVGELLSKLARYVIVIVIIGAAVHLKKEGKLDTEIVGLLSLIVGYVLGRQSSSEK